MAVAIIQRFGGALNLNVHIHALVVDGVFTNDGAGLRFHPACRLTRDDVGEVVAVVAWRIERLLARRGMTATSEENGATDTWAEEAPTLASLAAASVQGLIALGPRAGARVARYGSPPEAVGRSPSVRVTPTSAASTCTRGSSSDPASANGSSGGVATRCGRQSRRRGCAWTPTVTCGSRYGIHGPTARPICDSSPSRCWSVWRR